MVKKKKKKKKKERKRKEKGKKEKKRRRRRKEIWLYEVILMRSQKKIRKRLLETGRKFPVCYVCYKLG